MEEESATVKKEVTHTRMEDESATMKQKVTHVRMEEESGHYETGGNSR